MPNTSQQEPQTGAFLNIRQLDNAAQECIGHCSGCHNICVNTIAHCLDMGGEHANRAHIGLLQDCADACRMSTDLMLRGSTFHPQMCGLCAEICERCAEDCERLGQDDEVMMNCAALCRRCAESCRAMAEAAA